MLPGLREGYTQDLLHICEVVASNKPCVGLNVGLYRDVLHESEVMPYEHNDALVFHDVECCGLVLEGDKDSISLLTDR